MIGNVCGKEKLSVDYHTQWTAEGSVFGAVSLCFLCMKYCISSNRWTNLRRIHTEDMFGPSLGRVWRSRSKAKVTMDKNGIFGPYGRLRAVYVW